MLPLLKYKFLSCNASKLHIFKFDIYRIVCSSPNLLHQQNLRSSYFGQFSSKIQNFRPKVLIEIDGS